MARKIKIPNEQRKLYELYADHLMELIVQSKIKYSETCKDYLKRYKGLQFRENEIDRLILGNYVTNENSHKRPLVKLTKI